MKKLKLAGKISLILSVILVLVFGVFITAATLSAKSALEKVVYRELQAIALANAKGLQPILDTAQNTVDDMSRYLLTSYSKAAGGAGIASVLFPETILGNRQLNQTENYLMNTALNATMGDAGIQGVGVLFEPFQFDAYLKEYSMYATSDGQVRPFDTHENYAQQTWYQQAKEEQKLLFTRPLTEQGVLVIKAVMPIFFNNTFKGVVMVDIDLDAFSRLVLSSDAYPSMYSTIILDDGTLIYHSQDNALFGSDAKQGYPDPNAYDGIVAAVAQDGTYHFSGRDQGGNDVHKFFQPIKAGDSQWMTVCALSAADVDKEAVKTGTLLAALSVGAMLLIFGVIVVTVRSVMKPVGKVMTAAEQLSRGNLSIELYSQSQDEIGILADTFQKMAGTLRDIINDVSHLLGEMGRGNFDVRTQDETRYVGDFMGMLTAIRAINRSLSETLSQINQASQQVSAGSEQVAAGAQALSQGATQQAASVEELAATVTEISTKVSENAENALLANHQAITVGGEMEQTNNRMQDMIKAMKEISASSGKISKIMKTVEDIAFQTNILALNAAVEAARAGAAGKGFAVVADEVRSLASKSAEASKNTAQLIEGSIKAVEKGVHLADEAALSMTQAVQRTQEVTATVDRISQASGQQAESIIQVTLGIDQISAVVQTNSATAQESAAASEELSSQAEMLKQLVGHFQLRQYGDDAPVNVRSDETDYPYAYSAAQDGYTGTDKY